MTKQDHVQRIIDALMGSTYWESYDDEVRIGNLKGMKIEISAIIDEVRKEALDEVIDAMGWDQSSDSCRETARKVRDGTFTWSKGSKWAKREVKE